MTQEQLKAFDFFLLCFLENCDPDGLMYKAIEELRETLRERK